MKMESKKQDKIFEIIENSFENEISEISAKRISAAIIAGGEMICCAREKLPDTPSWFSSASSFLLYSLTKTLISICILKLFNAGRLSLDDNLGKWFPKLNNSCGISLFNCLRHTGGLPDYGGLGEYHNAVKAGCKPWTFDEFLRRTVKNELLFKPGDNFAYSNIGYMLLKRILEIEYGTSFSDIITREIFNPLSLKSACVIESKNELLNVILGSSSYLRAEGTPGNVYEKYDPGWVSHGVAAADAYETALIYNGLFNGKILHRDTVNAMTVSFPVAGVTGRPFSNPGYGLGLMIDDSYRGKICGHTGGGPGSSAACYTLLDDSEPLTIAVFTDGEDSVQAERIIYKIFEDVFPGCVS